MNVRSLSALLLLIACSGGPNAPSGSADGGSSSGTSSSGSSSSGSSSTTDAAAADGSTNADSGSAKCSPSPELDADCATKYGTAAPHGYVCTDVFFNPPPCEPLDTRGCTEVCTNRCCP